MQFTCRIDNGFRPRHEVVKIVEINEAGCVFHQAVVLENFLRMNGL